MITICGWCPFPKLRTWWHSRVLRREVSHGLCWRCARDMEGR